MTPISTAKEKRLGNGRRTLALIVVLVLACVLLAFASVFVYRRYNALVNGSMGTAKQKELESEFNRIAPLPGAMRLRFGTMNKGSQGDVGGDYGTPKTYSEIRGHYDEELARNGWKLVKEAPVKIWGRDYGGKQTFYCKGSYTATLEWAGQQATVFGWNYSFGFSWGLFDECG